MGNFRSCRSYFTWLFSFNTYKGQKMSALVLINSVEVEFKSRDESVFIDSLALSKVFEKRHDHILRNIENLPNDEFRALNFNKSDYLDSRGRLQPCYNLTKDGFCLLVMGFTGEKAYKFKVEFINAFNKLLDENRRLKFGSYIDEISNLKAVQISQAKHNQDVINGYKSQILRKNDEILSLKQQILREKSNETAVILLGRANEKISEAYIEIQRIMANLCGDEFLKINLKDKLCKW